MEKDGIKVASNIRLIMILEVLMKDIIRGKGVQEVCDVLQEKYATIYRDLHVLRVHGYVREERGLFFCEPRFMGLALSFYEQMRVAQEGLVDLQNRVKKEAGVLNYDYGNE